MSSAATSSDPVLGGVWADLVGQEDALTALQRAVAEPASMTHAWLLTGPPGSGRSVAGRAFAAALQCERGGCGECRECRTALAGSHADVDVLTTQALSIGVDQTRDLVQLAGRAPSIGRYRCILVEDADRLTEHSGNALLKALEEPSARTVWILCAPSAQDVLVTIRSRTRQVRLVTPPAEKVAALLVSRDGIEAPMAAYAARAAQSHIGVARRLATDEGARMRRRDVLLLATSVRGVADAVGAAADVMAIAEAARDSTMTQTAERERTTLLQSLGADPAARTQPPAVRSQLNALDKQVKTRATRFTRDMIDRALVDLLSFYRDVAVVATEAGVELVNIDLRTEIETLARAGGPVFAVEAMDAIGLARTRIAANVAPLLALEAMWVSLIVR